MSLNSQSHKTVPNIGENCRKNYLGNKALDLSNFLDIDFDKNRILAMSKLV